MQEVQRVSRDNSQSYIWAHRSGAEGIGLAVAVAVVGVRGRRGQQEGQPSVPVHLADQCLERAGSASQQPLSGAAQHFLSQQEEAIQEYSELIRGQFNQLRMYCSPYKPSTLVLQALWIFEISLLISDQPKTLDRLLRDGNYSTLSALSCLGFIRSPTEYYFELLRMLLLFYERGVYFKNELIETAITVRSSVSHLLAYERI